MSGLIEMFQRLQQMQPQPSAPNTSGIAGAVSQLPPAMQELALAPPPMPGQGFDSLGQFSQQALGLAGLQPGMGGDLTRSTARLPYPIPGMGGEPYRPPNIMGGGAGGMGGLGGITELLTNYRLGLMQPTQPMVPPSFSGY